MYKLKRHIQVVRKLLSCIHTKLLKQQQPSNIKNITHVMCFGIVFANEDFGDEISTYCVSVYWIAKVILSEPTWLWFFVSPTNCGRQMTKDSTQTPATSNFARFVDIILGYVTGLYLKKKT